MRRLERGERVVGATIGLSLAGAGTDGPELRPEGERSRLTAKEAEVVSLLAQGSSNKQVALALFVSDATVKTHVQHIYAKLGVQNRHQVLTRAAELGLLT